MINSNDQNSVKPKINSKLPKLPKPELAEGEKALEKWANSIRDIDK